MSVDYIEHLKSAREKAGLTQKEVESQLGMRNLMIRDYEMGRLKLPVSTAMELASLYGTSVDQLLGMKPLEEKGKRALDNFKALFLKNGFEAMFFDPIIRAGLTDNSKTGDKELEYFSSSVFDLLTKELSFRQKETIVLEIGKFLNSLAGADGKVLPSERECVNFLLGSFGLESKIKSVSSTLGEKYLPNKLPSSFSKIELKHFLIWLMFFFAASDEFIAYQEVEYIEEVAEYLKMNRTNFLEIKNKFVKEKV